jgi:TolB-like protein/DNA-binding winged helix-turn-helix (wHTH) protein/Tfp pilus assembly protein PilF
MSNNDKDLYEFGPFRLDTGQQRLLRGDQRIPLQPKAFETLLFLVRNGEKLSLKEDLLNAVWPDAFVEESNLTQNVFVLRKALGDEDGDRRYIITVPGRGYRFAESVHIVPTSKTDVPTVPITPPPDITTKVATEKVLRAEPPATTPRSSFYFYWLALLAGMVLLCCVGYLALRQYRYGQAAAGTTRIMLAVLPFKNLTGDPEQEYFADGLTEELITQLGQLHPEQLGVISRTSVMCYKQGDKRLDQIARELSVQYVLEGSFRRTTDRVRITAQLIQAKDQTHIWAKDYDRRPEDVLAVQDDVALAVAREIQLRLTPRQQNYLARAHTVDPAAHDDYLRGRYFWNKRTEDAFHKAIEFFDRAIARDPNYAPAYAGLADSYLLLGGYGLTSQDEEMPEAKAAAQKALALDDQLAEAYTSLGLISLLYEWNWAEGEKDLKRAIQLDPNYSVAHEYYGDGYLWLVGKTDQAIAELRTAHELDPLSPIIATDFAKRLCEAHQYDEGMALFRRTLELDPDFAQAHYELSIVYERRKMYPEAIAEIKKITSWEDLGLTEAELGLVYARQGDRRQARRILEKLRSLSLHQYAEPADFAKIYVAMGESELAIKWLQIAYEQHSPVMLSLRRDPDFDSIRSDPRFQDLVLGVGPP